MRVRSTLPLLLVAVLASCKQGAPTPAPRPHAKVGAPYRADGVWRYPRARPTYLARGLASIYPPGTRGLTADGEAYSPRAFAAAHPTLQLPVIARVTNLANGRQVVLRINDRGPADPGQILEVTPRAAAALGFARGTLAEVQVQLLSAPTLALSASLGGSAAGLAASAAPVGAVTAVALPRPGAPASPPVAAATTPPGTPAAAIPAAERPGTVRQVPPAPGRLYVQAGAFGGVADADRLAARYIGLAPRVVAIERHGRTLYAIRIGPFDRPADAEAVLHRALAAGLDQARIVVE
ncbi:MAG: septal ring lytic transglycosylase RlpA family protein [Acetobacteraceae bacterium]